jgi:hypothetical protein
MAIILECRGKKITLVTISTSHIIADYAKQWIVVPIGSFIQAKQNKFLGTDILVERAGWHTCT